MKRIHEVAERVDPRTSETREGQVCTGDERIGRILKARRLAYGLTQKKVAEHTGISSVSLSQFENAKVTPSLTSMVKLCHFYDLDIMEVCSSVLEVPGE